MHSWEFPTGYRVVFANSLRTREKSHFCTINFPQKKTSHLLNNRLWVADAVSTSRTVNWKVSLAQHYTRFDLFINLKQRKTIYYYLQLPKHKKAQLIMIRIDVIILKLFYFHTRATHRLDGWNFRRTIYLGRSSKFRWKLLKKGSSKQKLWNVLTFCLIHQPWQIVKDKYLVQ